MKWPSFLLPVWFVSLALSLAGAEKAFLSSELIFPLEHWHNHGSCIVEMPDGGLMVCWFHGSGERKADDVKIEGARRRKGATAWSGRFTCNTSLISQRGGPSRR